MHAPKGKIPVTGTQQDPTSSNKTQIIAALLVIVVSFALVGLMMLLNYVNLDLAILGTFILALGFGGRIVMMLGNLHPIAEASVTRCCYIATALGALCFEPWSVRLWVAGVALAVMAVLDYIEYRVKGKRSM